MIWRYKTAERAALVTMSMVLWSLSGMAIEVTSAPQRVISKQVSWCATDSTTSIVTIAAGGCNFNKATLTGSARGFTQDIYWLRLDLHNSAEVEIERWLRVGHTRLKKVSLFEVDKDGIWQHIDTGIDVPRSLRPVVAANPILPLRLNAGESKTVYVRVASDTTVDLSLTLWQQEAYVEATHQMELLHVLSVGSLLTVVLFTLLFYIKWHDRVYLYFGLAILSSIVVDAGYTGMIQTYLWPAELAFDLRSLIISVGFMFLFYVLFIREFIGEVPRYQRYYWVQLITLLTLLLSILWACLINYGNAIQLFSLSILAVILSGVALFIRSWLNGSRSAGYLVVACIMLLISFTYRITIAFGGSDLSSVHYMIDYLWRFFFVIPSLLAAIHLRSEELRDEAQQTAARIQFLAQMSHEFRTPLSIILAYAELLERNSPSITMQDATAMIKRSGRYLLGMIDEILDHARGEAGKLALSVLPTHWASFFRALEQSTVLMLSSRGNQFELKQMGELPEALILDERRLRQVLDILLSNANRYTQHGYITLICAVAMANHKLRRLTFSVSDTGAGISPEDFRLIFQPFVRGTAGKKSGIDGCGMGLAIAQQLVMLMNGKISVESELGKGSQFSFSIECKLAESVVESVLMPRQGKLSQQCTVLVVEDEAEICMLLATLLSDCGFSVTTAKSANEARQFLGSSIDIVITDQFMRDGDGWQVLQDWESCQIPVFLLSAAPPQRPYNFPSGLNFSCIILKPFIASELLAAISEILVLKWEAAEDAPPQIDAIKPPMELLAPLMVMIEEGAVTDIAVWLKSFIQQYPEYSAYAAKISACSLELDFDGLRKLILK